MALPNKNITEFPKNFALLKLLEKQSAHGTDEKQNEHLSREALRVKKGNLSSSDKSSLSTQGFSSPMDSPDGRNKNDSLIRSTFSQQSMFSSMHADTNVCKEHARKFEVVCLEDRCRICTNCALFGSHKNHEIKPEDEVLKEIAIKAEKLIDVFLAIEKSQSSMLDQKAAEKFTESVKKKYDEIVKMVRQKFNDYVSVIRTTERKLLNEIIEKFTKMEGELEAIRQLPRDLQEKLGFWKSITQETLLSVNEKSEKGELAFELLEDRASPKNDLLTTGQKLILELERQAEMSTRVLDNSLKKVSMTFDKNFIKNLEACYLFEVPDISASADSNPREDKPSRSSQDIINRSSPKFVSGNPVSRSTYTILLESNIAENQKLLESPPKQKSVKFTQSVTSLDNEINLNSSKIESINDRISGVSLEKGIEGDTPLLNFEWKDLDHGIQVTDPSAQFINKQQYSSKKPNVHHHRRSSTEVFYSNNISQEDGRLDFDNNSERLSIPYDKDAQANATSLLNVPIDQRHGRKSSYSSQKNLSRTSSPWNGNGSERMSKSPRPKRKSIKVADKFEPTINGIEQNNIDTADLTTAELSDQGVFTLVEHLRENTTLRSLKLLKNKITDEGGVALANLLYQNKTLRTINLTQNFLTEKTLDAFFEVLRKQRSIRLKTLYLSQNAMSLRNVKAKVKEFADIGVNVVL